MGKFMSCIHGEREALFNKLFKSEISPISIFISLKH